MTKRSQNSPGHYLPKLNETLSVHIDSGYPSIHYELNRGNSNESIWNINSRIIQVIRLLYSIIDNTMLSILDVKQKIDALGFTYHLNFEHDANGDVQAHAESPSVRVLVGKDNITIQDKALTSTYFHIDIDTMHILARCMQLLNN